MTTGYNRNISVSQNVLKFQYSGFIRQSRVEGEDEGWFHWKSPRLHKSISSKAEIFSDWSSQYPKIFDKKIVRTFISVSWLFWNNKIPPFGL